MSKVLVDIINEEDILEIENLEVLRNMILSQGLQNSNEQFTLSAAMMYKILSELIKLKELHDE